MQIPSERLADFIDRWKIAFDETLSDTDARSTATQLLELARCLHRPLPPKGQQLLEELHDCVGDHEASGDHS